MNWTYADLQQLEYRKSSDSVWVFDESTQQLTHLSLRGNKSLREIRFEAPQPRLRYLDASDCRLEWVYFAQPCEHLRALYLQHNQLKQLELPARFLPALELLDLSHNEELRELQIRGELPRLLYLYLYQCDLRDLSGLAPYFLREEFDFSVEGNGNLIGPPVSIVKQGKGAVVSYFRRMAKEGKAYLYEAKLLILGDPRAGKTTLARKLKDPAAPLPEEDETTRGVKLTSWDFEYPFTGKGNQNLLVNVWDFGGQTIYKQTHRFFLTQRSLYVVLSDGGSSERTDFPYWLHQTKVFGKGSPVLIFINEKEDRKFEPPMKELQKINPDLKGKLAVNLANAAARDNDRFCKALDTIKGQLAGLEHLGEPVPKGWKHIRDHFLKMEREGEKVVSWTDFKQVCERHGTADMEDQKRIARYFHDIGIFLHFHDDDLLCKQIFINKQWILNGAYRVVDNEEVEERGGKLKVADFNALFSGEYEDYRAEIRALLKRFYLVYEKDGYFVVPQRLPENAPEYPWEGRESIRFNFVYEDYMPAGILWQFMVENHRNIKDDLIWRRGVVLQFDKTVAEVIEEYGKDVIKIRVSGPMREDVRAAIIRDLQRINDKFEDLKVLWKIPCICERCAASETPTEFDYKKLRSMYSKGREQEWCDQLEGDVSVESLLRGVENMKREGGNYQSTDDLGRSIAEALGLVTKDDIKSLHVRHDRHDDAFRKLEALSDKYYQNLFSSNQQTIEQVKQMLEQLEDQEEALKDIKAFVRGRHENETVADTKKVLADDGIDMTLKLKLATPLYLQEFLGVRAELEFAKKEKMPRSWKEFKALFVKKK